MTLGLPVSSRVEGAAENRFDLLDKGVPQTADHAACLESPDELRGRWNTDIAANQCLFEPLPGLVVTRVERRRRELLGQRTATLRQRLADASEDAVSFGLVGLGQLVAEKLGPGTTHAVAATGCSALGRRRDTTCDTPSGPIVTPYRISAASIVLF